ncbi:MAG: mechanosensitive ion channel protein MscS [Verrucomicrobiales bacterium]|nr:mechanosensitive ion channel protein MscS [Verrucomicrobiales bacterium]|tara:strand:+ start:1162 stop:2067 length:906 start_codon:yes stop_codon:yes gene_type:complete
MEMLNSIYEVAHRVLTFHLFKMGEGHVTLGGLLFLGILFVLIIIGERVFRERVIMRIFDKTDLPESLEYGIARIIGYVLMLIGFYMAFQVVGVDLSSLAFIAGAVGVGIGFGLQNIINNFVSGVIILAERPIAIGDRIEVGGTAGRVVKISLRSTTVITNDNITMIVPNGDFISQTVTNWSHGDPKVRIRIPIGVAYGTDPQLVERLLLEVAHEHPKTLDQPKPVVLFEAFGDNSLNFELAAWTSEMTTRPKRYMSELNFAIEKKLRENDVEIPFPQRDLHVRSGVLEIKKAADGEPVAAL